jgi:NTE family protein
MSWWSRLFSVPAPPPKVSIGLALGGGFARGIAHVGVLRAFERNGIPIDYIGGVSAGAIIAAAYASGTSLDEIEATASRMNFKDVARWTLSMMGFAASERMEIFLHQLLKVYTFEQMKTPLAIVASDLSTGEPVVFNRVGDVCLPVRASCSYPGLFKPVQHKGKFLVDGGVTMELPARPLRDMGATHVISVVLPAPEVAPDPANMMAVVNRCFQILQRRVEAEWRAISDIVLAPEVFAHSWDGFRGASRLVQAGEQAAEAAMPTIKTWIDPPRRSAAKRSNPPRPAQR